MSRDFADKMWHSVFDDYYFIYSKDCIFGEINDFIPGQLYIRSFINGEKSVLVEKQVTAFGFVGERIFYSSGDCIYSIDRLGNDEKVVLQADGAVSHFNADDKLVFYVADEIMYRFYIPSETIDLIGYVPGILDFLPITNNKVSWWVRNPDWTETINDNYGSGSPVSAVIYYVIEMPGDEASLTQNKTEAAADAAPPF